MENSTEKKRVRRTNAQLDECIDLAISKQIIKRGFVGVSLLGVAKEAKVETAVLYKRFGGLTGLLKSYSEKHDFWFSSSFEVDERKSPKENLKRLFTNLIDELYGNDFMQRFLLWELLNESDITREVANNRERNGKGVLEYYRKAAKKIGLDSDAVLALITSGIYYLVLHRKISTFATIDFDTEKGKEQLVRMIESLVDRLFK